MRLTTTSAVMALTTGLAVAFGSPGFAQQAPQQPTQQNGSACASGPGQKGCTTSKPQAQKGARQSGQKPQGEHRKAQPQGAQKGNGAQQSARPSQERGGPRIGESARRAPQLQQARDSRLPAPPQGQHYRVMDDRVVRVDDSTQKIVAIIGLASQLLGQ